MLIVEATSNIQNIKRVVFYCETSKNDYVLNHMLCIICDTHDSEDVRTAKKYNNIGDNVIASDRKCIVKIINAKRG